MRKLIFLALLFFSFTGYSQKKILQAKSFSGNIEIDGKIDESVWENVPVATDFVMFQPDNGKPIPENKKTEVKVLYDNHFVYIAAKMFDNEPSKILKEMTQRDDFGASDSFGVFINGFNDGQQDFQFYVSAADGQADCIVTDSNGEDYSWDAVWKSKATITSFGWVVEMRIPYAALRFSSEKIQTWGINFFRDIKRDRQKYSWNFIDSKIGTFTQQNGTLQGISNIKPPTRLFFLPYSSFYLNADSAQKTKGTLKGGLDVKYGINDAFTLDLILIPDFGQTKYDDKILNLGPFEQQFNENRAFFTEGTDLFSKGNLLYSRRIGEKPPEFVTADNEEIIDNPSSVNLINALKISGRTKKGLGIGFLNAVTEKTFATIKNTDNQEQRKEIVAPLSNYNVLVLDQRFHKNSSATFVNTNVLREGSSKDANVSALVWDLNTTKNTYNLSGDFKYSFINDDEVKKGISSQLNLSETSGSYRYSIGADITTKNYDNNDLGINYETNFHSFYGNASYRILNPTRIFNTFAAYLNVYTQFQNQTQQLIANNINVNINSTNKKNHYFGMGINANPLKTFDYYEPRADNRFVSIPSRAGIYFYFSSNYNYKFAVDINPSFALINEKDRNTFSINVSPRYRFNNKFALNYSFLFLKQNNNKGFVDSVDLDNNPKTENTIVFANREITTYTNTISGKYSVNSKMNFNISVRHYWSYVENKNYLSLEEDSNLTALSSYSKNKNFNFNSWNLDLSYSWWFAPGSQISILYRNNAALFEREIDKDFGKNVNNLLNNDALSHVFSISIKYFIDYNQAKHWY